MHNAKYLQIDNSIKSLIVYIVFFTTCIFILFQSPLAPYASGIPNLDSGVFIYCAKSILHGNLIYKDIFDHKGIFLYLIQIIGLKIHEDRFLGIWIMEVISLFLTSIILYKTVNLLLNRFIAFLSVWLSLLFIINLTEGGGNYTEEWALPYISIALYIFVIYFSKTRSLSTFNLFILSVTFVLSFLLRPNQIAVWVGFGITISFDLIKNHRLHEFLRYLFLTVLFVSICISPFFIYATANNILDEAYYSIFKFNTSKYIQQDFIIILRKIFNEFSGNGVLGYYFTFFIIFTFVHFKHHQHKELLIAIVLSLLLSIISCSIGRNHPHYFILYVPLLALVFGFGLKLIHDSLYYSKKIFIVLLILVFCYNPLQKGKYLIKENYSELLSEYYGSKATKYMIASKVKELTKNEDKILVIGSSCYIYLLSDRFASSKYFYSASILDINPEIRDLFCKELEYNPPKLIVTDFLYKDPNLWWGMDKINVTPRIQAILDKYYEKIDLQISLVDIYMRKQSL